MTRSVRRVKIWPPQPPRGLFVNVLVHSVMIAVMLLHSICGCCWHHSHDECCSSGAECHADHVAAETHDSHDGHSDTCGHSHVADHSPVSGETPHEPHAPGPCNHEECVYVAAKVLGGPVTFEFAFVTSLDCPCAAGAVVDLHRRVETAEASPRRLSSLEACALLQVWRV